jgi:hypothetical protein
MRSINIFLPTRCLLISDEEFCLDDSSETFITHRRHFLEDLQTREENIVTYIKGGVSEDLHWIYVAKDKTQWPSFVGNVMKLRVL